MILLMIQAAGEEMENQGSSKALCPNQSSTGAESRGRVHNFSIKWTSDYLHTAENELFPAGV